MTNEEQIRQQALSMHLSGKNPTQIAKALGRTRQWVYKWLSRHSSGGDNWNVSLSNAPHSLPNRTSDQVEKLVVQIRKELRENPYMEQGAYVIFHQLEKMGIQPPSVATINRILKKNGLMETKQPYRKKGIEYPEMPLNTQSMDLIGPRYLTGAMRYYLLTIISYDTRQAGVYPLEDKSAESVTCGVISFWKTYSIPDFLQLDNELSFKGSNRHPRGLGLLMRTALSLGVTPRFIPVSEPWRNGVVERFNQKVEKTLLSQQHKSMAELAEHAASFMEVHNNTHNYSTKMHLTPSELQQEIGCPLNPLDTDYEIQERPLLDCWNRNEIHFIRLVRSDCSISVLNTEVNVPSSLMYSYVEARLAINEHRLLIYQDGHLKHSVEFTMPVI